MTADLRAELPSRFILGMRTHSVSYESAIDRVIGWASARESRYVCFADTHMVIEAHDDEAFRRIVNGAGITAPDGVPLVWALRLLGLPDASRTCGPDATPRILAAAQDSGIPVGFYGGTPEALAELVRRCQAQFPHLEIAYSCSPPFRAVSADEDAQIVRDIAASGARILFVGLGCPKQERWMADHVERLPLVMLGVGAAFDFMAGTAPRAPVFMQRVGLEWLARLASNPQRLWRRYLVQNPRFLTLFARQFAALLRK